MFLFVFEKKSEINLLQCLKCKSIFYHIGPQTKNWKSSSNDLAIEGIPISLRDHLKMYRLIEDQEKSSSLPPTCVGETSL